MTENKKIVVEFEPNKSDVVIHHRIVGETEDYQVQTKTDLIGEPYASGSIKIAGYELVNMSNNTSGFYSKETTDVY